MISYKLKRFFLDIQSRIKALSSLLESIGLIADLQVTVERYVLLIAEGGSQLPVQANYLYTDLTNSSRSVAQIRVRKFFSDLEIFQEILTDVGKTVPDSSFYIEELEEKIIEFSDFYDDFLSLQNAQNVAKLTSAASILNRDIHRFLKSLEFICDALDSNNGVDEKPGLTLLLPATLNFKEFIDKLSALQTIYSELCQLLGVSESDDPLRIEKIESGSLLISLFGNDNILALIVDFLKSSASFFYRNYTTEGKISAIPSRLESLNAILEFTEKLDSLGVETKSMKVELSKSGQAIAKNLTELLDRQGSITINDSEINLAPRQDQNFLELRRPKQLTSITGTDANLSES